VCNSEEVIRAIEKAISHLDADRVASAAQVLGEVRYLLVHSLPLPASSDKESGGFVVVGK
jgi:hypothetical protein